MWLRLLHTISALVAGIGVTNGNPRSAIVMALATPAVGLAATGRVVVGRHGATTSRALARSAAERFSTAVKSEAEATKRELAQLREEYSKYLVRSHAERLEQAKRSAAKFAALEQANSVMTNELETTQRAYADYLAKAHDAKLEMMEASKHALNEAYAELNEVRAAYAAYMVAAHERRTEAAAELDRKTAALDRLQAEFDELKESYGKYVEDTDALVEDQGNELRAARKTLAAVAAAVATVKPDAAA